jgi:ubiquinone/menaquinone biosynthesis C-methylase UbiE
MRGIEQIPWVYDAICVFAEATGLARWRRWLVSGARGRTLDLGCGTGRNLPLAPAGVTVIGLDPSEDALRRARRRAPHVPLVLASAEALPFRDATFETVLSGLVFCSVPDATRGLHEVRRVLRPDGQLRMMEHVRSTRPWKARFQDRIAPLWSRLSGGCHPNRETERTVVGAGFEIEPESHRATRDMRRFSARARPALPPRADPALHSPP